MERVLWVLELMNTEIKGEGYDGVVLGSMQSIGLLSEKRDSTHPYRCCLLAFGRACYRIAQL